MEFQIWKGLRIFEVMTDGEVNQIVHNQHVWYARGLGAYAKIFKARKLGTSILDAAASGSELQSQSQLGA